MNKKSSKEQVAVGKWVADVRTRYDNGSSFIRRKVLTNGIRTVDMSRTIPGIIDALRSGNEVRFSDGEEEVLRLFPCLDKDFNEMFVAAQTMGGFRNSLADIEFEIVRKDGKQLSDIRRDRRIMVKARENHERVEVTPDTLVTCPECGCEFRVGKALGK